MRRIYSAPYFDTAFSGCTGVTADRTDFTLEQNKHSGLLVYIVVQLPFNSGFYESCELGLPIF